MALSYADVGEILKMIDTSSCTEVVLEIDGIKMVVRKGGQGSSSLESAAIPDASLSDIDAPRKGKLMTQTTPQPIDKADAGEAMLGKGDIIKSPMVGTIYLQPEPDSDPFVKIGDKVTKGQTLLIVEAMKTMNDIVAEKDGTVKEIIVKNEQPVQFDDPLIIVE